MIPLATISFGLHNIFFSRKKVEKNSSGIRGEKIGLILAPKKKYLIGVCDSENKLSEMGLNCTSSHNFKALL